MKKILVANPFGLGDAIFSLFLVEALRAQFPDAAIDFLGNERTEALLRMDASVRRVHVLNRDHLRSFWPSNPLAFWKASSALLSAIRNERYDVLFDLSLGREFSFHARLMGIRERIGFDYKGRGLWLTKKIALEGYEGRSVALRQFELMGLAGGLPAAKISGRLPLRVSGAAESSAEKWLGEAGLGRAPFFVLAPGGGRSWGAQAVYKQWSPERFAGIVRRLAEKGVGAVLLGDELERPLMEEVRKASRVEARIGAGLPIGEVCAILKRGRGILANDGGLAHLASALGVKTLAIFGPVDETAYGPFMAPEGSGVLTEPVPCRPCYGKFHFPACAHARICLEHLSVDRVWLAVNEMV